MGKRFPKPRYIFGIAKDLPVPEMEKLIFTDIAVTKDDLRQVAAQRALAVSDRIVTAGQVEQGRVFLVEAKLLEPEKKE